MSAKSRLFLICLLPVLAAIAAFEPVRHNGFVYDDEQYITKNLHVNKGLSWDSFAWVCRNSYAGNWHTLTWLSHMLDCELFGLDPLRHHLVNVLLHCVNAVLLFLLLRYMTGSIGPSIFVAAAFALHPLRVESVVWIAERKDVLSGLFWLLTIAAYLYYIKRLTAGSYILVLVTFCLGLTAKAMLVSLPLVLLMLDYWPLQRQKTIRTLILEKAGLLAAAIPACFVTYYIQQEAGAITKGDFLPLYLRIANAVVSYLGYMGKIIYPANLAVLYPFPTGGIALYKVIIAAAVMVAVSVFVLRYRRSCGYLLTGWFWYVVTLLPVIGLVQVGHQSMADRYSYIPSIGIFIMAAWLMSRFCERNPKIKTWVTAGAVIILAVWLWCTRVQVRYWRDDLTLFERAIAVTEDNYIAHYNCGYALRKQANNDEAIRHFQEVIRIKPTYAGAYSQLGNAYHQEGNQVQALLCWRKLLELEPDRADVLNSAAWVMAVSTEQYVRNPQLSVELARRACEITNYKDPAILDTMAVAYGAQGDFTMALRIAEKALAMAETMGYDEMAEEIKSHISLFRNNEPCCR